MRVARPRNERRRASRPGSDLLHGVHAVREALRAQVMAGLVGWVQGFVAAMQEEKARRGVLDFQDLLIFSRNLLRDKNFKSTQEVCWVTGACLLARAEAVREVGLFDENFIIYYEDGDWC